MIKKIFSLFLFPFFLYSSPAEDAQIPGHYLVAFKPGRGRTAVRLPSFEKIKKFRENPDLIEVISSDKNFAANHRDVTDISYIEPVYRVHTFLDDGDDDGDEDDNDGANDEANKDPLPPQIPSVKDPMDYNIVLDQWGLGALEITKAWKKSTGTAKVVVAVVDTGVDYTHTNLRDNIWRNPEEIADNGIDDDGDGFVDDVVGWDFYANDPLPFDYAGHGTHVAGTIASYGKVWGVAPNVVIMPLRFLGPHGSGSTADAIRAIDFAVAHHVQVINASWGGPGDSRALSEAISRANQAGILFVSAAGNSENNNDEEPSYPASYKYSNVISVAAVDRAGNLTSFSNYGLNSVHVAAPGKEILSTLPDEKIGKLNGTSMASPFVAGLAALIYSLHPEYDMFQVKDIILRTGKVSGNLPTRTQTGKVVNAHQALTD